MIVRSWVLQRDAVLRLFRLPGACLVPTGARCLLNSTARSLQVSLVALSLTGNLLVPSPLAPITNTAPFGVPGGAPPAASPPPMAYMQPPQLQQQFGAMSLGPAPLPPPQQQQSAAEAAAALAAELGVDTVTAQRIYELQQQKQQVRPDPVLHGQAGGLRTGPPSVAVAPRCAHPAVILAAPASPLRTGGGPRGL